MSTDPAVTSDPARGGDMDWTTAPPADIPVGRGRAVAQGRVNTGSEDSGHEAGTAGLRTLSDRVDAPVDLNQESGLQPVAQRCGRNPCIEQLAPGDLAVLTIRKARNELTGVTRSRLTL